MTSVTGQPAYSGARMPRDLYARVHSNSVQSEGVPRRVRRPVFAGPGDRGQTGAADENRADREISE